MSEKETSSNFVKEKDFDAFKNIITGSGYVCRTCEGGHFMGENEEGKVFRIYCNDNSLRYKVVMPPSGIPFVRPWS